jgi:hypothetical protein
MKLTTPKSFLLSVLAATLTSSVTSTEEDQFRRLLNRDVETDFGTRIVGGEQAEKFDYPYFVQMQGCGGALVAPDVVLFAAHCTNYFKNRQFSIGAYEDKTDDAGAEGRFCDEWIADPNYDPDESPPNYDFALCKLDKPIYIDQSKVRLELNQQANVPSNTEDLLVMGFGRLKEGGETPDFLQEVEVEYVTNNVCNQRESYNGQITNQMLCAGFRDGGLDACQGDSGGPIVRRKEMPDGTFVDTHVGVVSWGSGCAQARKYGVYSRTSSRYAWIRSTICTRFNSVADYCDNPPPAACNGAEITIKVETDKYGEEPYWSLRDSRNRLVKERKFMIKWHESVSELCVQGNECYDFKITDSFGDGLCTDSEGCGSYSIWVNGVKKVNGNPAFGKEATHRICTVPLPSPTPPPTPPSTPPPTPPPTTPPTPPTPPPTNSICENDRRDDPDFRANGIDKRDCNWIAKKPEIRCPLDNKALEKCPSACNQGCNDIVCKDNTDFRANGKDNRNCDWIAEKPHIRCILDEAALQKCPSVCSPDCAGICQIDGDYRNKNISKRDCDWVANKPDVRCGLTNNEPFVKCSGVCNPFCNRPDAVEESSLETKKLRRGGEDNIFERKSSKADRRT